MKRLLLTLSLALAFFLCTTVAHAQITFLDSYEQNNGSAGINMPLTGNDGTRNIFTGTSAVTGEQYKIIFASNRWEIQLLSGGNWIALYYNTTATFPNPPSKTNGTWVTTPVNSGETLTTLTGNVIAPTTINSLNLATGSPGNTSTIQFTAVFAANITGLTVSNFSLASTTTGASITSVSGSGSSYTVTVNAGTGNGTVQLKMANTTGLAPQISTSLPFAGGTYTLDTSAPAAPSTPDMTTGSDTGTSSSDNLTKTTTPTFTGTAESGATVKLYDTDGTTLLGSGTATGGNYSITTSALSNGAHTITAKATDVAGNISTASSGLSITIDTTTPTLTITSNVSTLKIGETATITFTFSEDPGSTFTSGDISISGGTLGAISGTGLTRTATFTPTASTNAGTVSITVAASSYTDAAGNNGGAGTTPTLTFDTAAPAAPSTPDLTTGSDSGTSSSDNLTKTTTPTFTGTAESGATVTLYDTDGTTVLGTGTATGGNYSITVSALSAGSHTITAKATDVAGNTGTASSGLLITIDTTTPTLTITSNVSTLKIGQTATITFTFSEDPGSTFVWDGSTGDVTVSGGTLGAISGTGLTRTATFTPTASTNGGTASITVAASSYTDAAGNNGGAGTTPSLTFDTAAPAAPSTPDMTAGTDSGTSNSDNITNITTPTFTGTAESGATVTLYDTDGTTVLGSGTATGGNYSITSTTLSVGSHTITTKTTDVAGNVGAASSGLTITIDTTSPTVAITSNVSTLKIGETATITFTFSEDPGSSFINGDINVSGGTLSAISGTGLTRTATFTPTTNTNSGTASITVGGATYQDVAGNVGSAGTTPTLTFDTQAPAAPSTPDMTAGNDTGTSNTDNLTKMVTPTFTGTAESGSTVILYDTDGTTILGSGTATAGNYSITTSTLSSGAHTITAKATDVAGNISTASSGLSVTIDITSPTLTITSDFSALKIGETATITFTFSEDPGTTFTWNGTTGDVTVSGGTLGAISGTGLTRTATFTPTAGTNGGTASITVAISSYTDAAGNSGLAGTTPTLTFDTQAPAAPSTPDMTAGTDTGTSSTDNLTKNTTPTFAGTAESGATVTLYDTDDTTILGTGTATGGNYSITSSTLSSGAHTITAKTTDVAGNISTASSGLALTIDTTLPTATIVVSDAILLIGETSPVTITFNEAVTGFTNADLAIQNGTLSSVASADGITWTATLTPAAATTDPTNVITLDNTGVIDAAGNAGTGTTTSNNYAVDTNLGTLPIKLISFTGKLNGNRVKLDFVTESEENNDRFEIERSLDGKIFKNLTTIKGNGTTNATHNYSAIDYSPISGINYYRLKQVDNNGNINDYGIIAVNVKLESVVVVRAYPNPTTDEINVSFSNTTTKSAKIVLTDMNGRTIHTETIILEDGKSGYKLHQPKLAPGQYILNVTGEGLKTAIKIITL